MKCICCDRNLKDHEAVRRHAITNEFLDICDVCLKDIPGLPTKAGQGVDTVSDPFEDSEDAVEVESVTKCYNLDEDDH